MDSVPQQIILQVILILINAFFASTEIAVISLNATKLKKMSEDGDKTAKRLLRLVEEPAGFLSTIQIGITLAGFLGSAFAAENFSQYLVDWIYNGLGFRGIPVSVLNTLSVIVITIILSYFTLILGELVPKRIAMQKPYAVAKFACPVVSAVAFIMRPVVFFLSLSTNAVLRLLRMKTEAEEESVTEEEIRMMVDLGEEKGVIDEEEKEWIQNVFAFDDTPARDIMTHSTDVEFISLHASEQEIIDTVKSSGKSRFPVYDKDFDDVVGVLYARDFLMADAGERRHLKGLLRAPYFIPESISADKLFKDMQTKKIHFAVVIDEFGQVSGIVTMEDLLEEIVGNIYDEYDASEEKELEQLSETVWRVNGECDIESLSEELGVDSLESPDYDTVGGFIFSQLHTIPKDGTTFDLKFDSLIFHVTEIENRRIKEVLVERHEEASEKQDRDVIKEA
ncbi:MAG: HlyC/CorC family transporter [Clostridiales bacterium]|nr:HlyC/CorC family transporter [Clostridiales bacterium]